MALEPEAWLAAVLAECEGVDPVELRLLELAADALARHTAARDVLDAEGTTYRDRFGQPRARPEVAVERDTRAEFVSIIRRLGLDEEKAARGSSARRRTSPLWSRRWRRGGGGCRRSGAPPR